MILCLARSRMVPQGWMCAVNLTVHLQQVSAPAAASARWRDSGDVDGGSSRSCKAAACAAKGLRDVDALVLSFSLRRSPEAPRQALPRDRWPRLESTSELWKQGDHRKPRLSLAGSALEGSFPKAGKEGLGRGS